MEMTHTVSIHTVFILTSIGHSCTLPLVGKASSKYLSGKDGADLNVHNPSWVMSQMSQARYMLNDLNFTINHEYAN